MFDLDPSRELAIFSDHAAPNVSARYVHINSSEYIPLAKAAGWEVSNGGAKKRNRRSLSRNPAAQATASHFLEFQPSNEWLQNRGLLNNVVLNNGTSLSRIFPRLIMSNSHDKTDALKFRFGLMELVCLNGMVVCTDEWGHWSFRHTNIVPAKLLDFFNQVIEAAPYIFNLRNEMSKIDVSRDQAVELAENVIDLRWDGEKFAVDPTEIIKPRYQEQEQLNAYNVMQTVQGYLVNGGNTANNRSTHKTRKQRKINNFAAQTSINEGLWKRTGEWLKRMGYELPPPPLIKVDVR